MWVAVGSAKGSPGATSFALALAVVWPRAVVLVEADPAGGDLGGRFGLPDRPGLSSLVVAARRDQRPGLWCDHTQRLALGADVVVGSASARQARAAVSAMAEHPPPTEVDVIVDVGRLDPESPAWPLAMSAHALLPVSAGDLASLAHTASAIDECPDRDRVQVVVVGTSPFPAAEIEVTLGVAVLASVPTDRRSAAVLAGAAQAGRGWTRFGVPAAARTAAGLLLPDEEATVPAARRMRGLRIPALTRGGAS